MIPKITDDLQQAADAQGDHPVVVEHEGTRKVYYLYTEELHLRASRALEAVEDNAAIAEGIRQMENGEGRPLHEVDADVRRDFGLPPRQ